MKIGEAARLSGCHIETIRYYERIGLLPRAMRAENGYRDYSEGQVERLRFVTRGRELGFSLDEIRGLLALADNASLSCREVDHLARQHLADVQGRLRELGRIADELKRTIEGCRHGRPEQCTILDALRAPTSGKGKAAQTRLAS